MLAEYHDADSFAGGTTTAQLVNRSAARSNVLVGGFIISPGTSGASATVPLRAMRPPLAMLGVTGKLAALTMTLYNGNSKPNAMNTAWTAMPAMATGSTASLVHAGIEAATMVAMTRG